MFGSLLISSRIDMAEAALIASESPSLRRVDFTLSAERLIFLGTVSSLMIRSKTSTHCLITFSADMESPHFQDGKKVKDKSVPTCYDLVVIFKYMVALSRLISMAAMRC